MPDRVIVVDTSVLYAAAAPYELDEVKELRPAEIVIPFSVVSELDQLIQRPRDRDRARSALNVLRSLVGRGAIEAAVSCGDGLTIRIASAEEERPPPSLPVLDHNLADDRILSCAINLSSTDTEAILATSEFALYVKACGAGIGGLYLDRLVDVTAIVTRRERAAFEQAWSRLISAQDAWAVCRRGISFLQLPLVARLLQGVREEQSPEFIYQYVAKFDALASQWTETTDLRTILYQTLGLWPAQQVNRATVFVDEPARYGVPYIPASTRRETPDEKVVRIRAEEVAARGREDHNVDVVLAWMQLVRDYIAEQIGEEG